MMISAGIFFFLHFFKILIFQIISGVKGQKIAQKWQTIMCHTQYLRNRTSYDHIHIYHIHFFKILIFWVVMRVKGQKVTQKTLSIAPNISETRAQQIA